MVGQTIRVEKKYTVYLPKRIVEEMGIEEGNIPIVPASDGGINSQTD